LGFWVIRCRRQSVDGSGYHWSGQVVSVFESDTITATLLLYDGDWCEAILGNKTLLMIP